MATSSESGSAPTRASLLQLDHDRSKMEEELKEMLDVLKGQGVGMEEALVDAEGYPRNDIDVYQIRHARNRIICLRNDLKDIMAKIEAGMHGLHEKSRTEGNGTNCAENVSVPPPCFAIIDIVTPGSPAQEDGLRVGDRVAEFGNVNADNFGALSDVGKEVQRRKGQTVHVKVVRKKAEDSDDVEVKVVRLVPREWSGRGLLGCNIVPLPEPAAER